jgi:Ca-activated chloride channel family protein
LVSFWGTPSIVIPPTVDRATVQQSIGGLDVAESTASGEAIFASLQALTQVPPDPDHPEVVASPDLISSHAQEDVGELVAESPAAGFLASRLCQPALSRP